MSVRSRVLLVLALLLTCLTPWALAEEVAPGEPIVVVRTDGRQVEGTLSERTDTYLEVKMKFGSIKIPLDEVASTRAGKALPSGEDVGEGPGDAPAAAEGEAEEMFDRMIEALDEREVIEAHELYERMMTMTGDPLLADAEAQDELLEIADLHDGVRSFGSLGDYLEILVSRACTRCGGPGELRCKTCRGKGKLRCDDCKGRGQSKCSECRGKGKEKCPKCHGTTRMDCDDCGVNDRVCCGHSKPAKLGRLRRYRPSGNDPINNRGNGTPIYADCPECTNAGKDTCDTCEGNSRGVASGYVTCKRCRGEKKLRCERCGGRELAGICTTCDGDKSTSCSSCEGTGLNDEARGEEDR